MNDEIMDEQIYKNRRDRILEMRGKGDLTSRQTYNILLGLYFMKERKKLKE